MFTAATHCPSLGSRMCSCKLTENQGRVVESGGEKASVAAVPTLQDRELATPCGFGKGWREIHAYDTGSNRVVTLPTGT